MIVLDTHAWLWWVARSDQLSGGARRALDEATRIAVSAISCWEVGMLAKLGRIELDRPVEAWVGQALSTGRVEEAPVTARIATRAAALPSPDFPGDPADRIIYATAREHGAVLVTRDSGIRAFDPRATVW